jgi:hypothetical protein
VRKGPASRGLARVRGGDTACCSAERDTEHTTSYRCCQSPLLHPVPVVAPPSCVYHAAVVQMCRTRQPGVDGIGSRTWDERRDPKTRVREYPRWNSPSQTSCPGSISGACKGQGIGVDAYLTSSDQGWLYGNMQQRIVSSTTYFGFDSSSTYAARQSKR